jgi:hypothetical protein
MEPHGEASGIQGKNRIIVAGQNKSHGEASSPNHGPAEHSQSNRAPGKSGGNHHTQHSGHHNQQPQDLATVTSVDGFRVARTRGTMQRTQRLERRGLNV